jgi:hypothetical protein
MMRKEFNGYDYVTTLHYFRFTLLDPKSDINGITRAEWFSNCHGISSIDFKREIKKRETDWFYRRVLDIDEPIDLNKERKK